MAELHLTSGHVVLLDDADVYEVCKFSWHVNTSGYCCRGFRHNGKHGHQLMHRQLLNAPDGVDVDHINGNTLDNRRANLRLATKSQNHQNKAKISHVKGKRPSSVYKGVSFDKKTGRWKTSIRKERKSKPTFLGYYVTEQDAAAAYNQAAKTAFGVFAKLNAVPEYVPLTVSQVKAAQKLKQMNETTMEKNTQ
jgi:hypothetical protein